MTADDRLSHLENRLDSNEKTLHEHMLEDARVLAQIPHQLESLKAGDAYIREEIKGVREDVKAVHDTIERHSSRILTLEHAPAVAAANLQTSITTKILDTVIRWGVPVVIIAIFTYFSAGFDLQPRIAHPVPIVSSSPKGI